MFLVRSQLRGFFEIIYWFHAIGVRWVQVRVGRTHWNSRGLFSALHLRNASSAVKCVLTARSQKDRTDRRAGMGLGVRYVGKTLPYCNRNHISPLSLFNSIVSCLRTMDLPSSLANIFIEPLNNFNDDLCHNSSDLGLSFFAGRQKKNRTSTRTDGL